MTSKIISKKKIKTLSFNSAKYLTDETTIGFYIEEALSTNDHTLIATALGTVSRARGMSKVAKKFGLSRESLYKALGPDGNPEFGTIIRVMQALGLTLSVSPV